MTWVTWDISSWMNLSITDWLNIIFTDNTSAVAIMSPKFKSLGKLIAMRRMVQHETLRSGTQYNWEDMLANASAQVAKDSSYDVFTDQWMTSFRLFNNLILQYDNFATKVDNSIMQYLKFISSSILGIDPNISLPLQLEALVAYMQINSLTVPSGDGGFYDFFYAKYHDRNGAPIQLPIAPSGTFGPGWVSTNLV